MHKIKNRTIILMFLKYLNYKIEINANNYDNHTTKRKIKKVNQNAKNHTKITCIPATINHAQ